ncbi:hypothetical protein Q1695_015063 [Nippostrongylus brasiliensis]|nr:hypothetical protein Q1695_015063 [Nippostrongylus brasiliensis]
MPVVFPGKNMASSREEYTANSKLWDPDEGKTAKKEATTKSSSAENGPAKKGQPAAPAPPLKGSAEPNSKKSKLSSESATKKVQPNATNASNENVDLNDFVVRAAAINIVVDPQHVKKKGNIDDQTADPAKTKERMLQLEQDMKSTAEKTVDEDQNKSAEKVKWGDSKCVVYETKDQLTLEDDVDDAADVF